VKATVWVLNATGSTLLFKYVVLFVDLCVLRDLSLLNKILATKFTKNHKGHEALETSYKTCLRCWLYRQLLQSKWVTQQAMIVVMQS